MGCRILAGVANGEQKGACFYDSVTDWCFGPLMNDEEEAVSFMKWLPDDPRGIDDTELRKLYTKFQEEQDGN